MTTLYLIRHGRTVYSDSGRIAGSTDVSLSEAGRGITATLAKSGMPDIGQCYCSDLQRSQQTSEILCAQVPVIDPRIRELDFGEWENQTWDEIYTQDSDHLSQWSDDWVNLSPPGGETFAELAARCDHWLNEIASHAGKTPGETPLLVTAHGGSIRALLCNALGLPLSVAMSFVVDYSSVTTLQLGKRGNRCLGVNAKMFASADFA